MQDILIKSKIRNYRVKFVNDFKFLKGYANNHDCFFLIDKKIYTLHQKKLFKNIPSNVFLLDATEMTKTIPKVVKIYEILWGKKINRASCLIAIGGGVIQDVVGFVASTLFRGINWIYVPTTLLAQADSCIGSKTSLNFANHKNIIGTFYPASEIYINPIFLRTLSNRDYFSGIGEIIKLHLLETEVGNLKNLAKKINSTRGLKDPYKLLKVIKESLNIKKKFIEGDEFDQGKRSLLNYGHTLGHAIESQSLYQIPHGVAIIIGMIFANILSQSRKMLDEGLADFINQKLLLANLEFFEFPKNYFNKDGLLTKVRIDKKRTSSALTFIMLGKNLKPIRIDDVSDLEFQNALNQLKEILKERII